MRIKAWDHVPPAEAPYPSNVKLKAARLSITLCLEGWHRPGANDPELAEIRVCSLACQQAGIYVFCPSDPQC